MSLFGRWTAIKQAEDPMAGRDGLLPPIQQPQGLFGKLQSLRIDPRTAAGLQAAGQNLMASSGWTDMPTTSAQNFAQGISGYGQGVQGYDQAQAKAAADRINALIEQRKAEAQIRKDNASASKDESGGSMPFQGTGMDAQIANTLLNPNIDPASPTWQYAYQQYREPKTIFDPATGKLITVQPPKVQYIEDRYRSASQQPAEAVPPPTEDAGVTTSVQQVTEGAEARKAETTRDQSVTDRTWQLRNEYEVSRKAVSDYASKLSQAEALLASNQTGISDIALINTFQKLVDEGAVVRDQDVNLLASTGGAFGSLKQQVNNLRDGQKLPPEARVQMIEALKVLRGEFQKRTNSIAGDYRKRAQDFGLDPDKIAQQSPQPPPDPDKPSSALDRARAARGGK